MNLYRYEHYLSNGFESYATLEIYTIVKETSKGYWINYKDKSGIVFTDKFMLKDAKNKFAHKTEHEAIKAFIKRKKYYLKVLEERVARVKSVLQDANSILLKGIDKNKK